MLGFCVSRVVAELSMVTTMLGIQDDLETRQEYLAHDHCKTTKLRVTNSATDCLRFTLILAIGITDY